MLYQMENQHGGDVYGGGITLDFSANTNPLGTPPGVLDAVCRALPQLHRYSDPYCRRLVQAIATHEQVPASYVLCGNGAADLIYAYCAEKFFGIAAITGGAIGNFIDRISTGLVIDMICIPWFSTFNVADLFITFGALILVVYILTKDKELLADKPKEQKKPHDADA